MGKLFLVYEIPETPEADLTLSDVPVPVDGAAHSCLRIVEMEEAYGGGPAPGLELGGDAPPDGFQPYVVASREEMGGVQTEAHPVGCTDGPAYARQLVDALPYCLSLS